MAGQTSGTSSFDFSGATVVVTGAGSGIGLGIAQAFHVAGAVAGLSQQAASAKVYSVTSNRRSSIGAERISDL